MAARGTPVATCAAYARRRLVMPSTTATSSPPPAIAIATTIARSTRSMAPR
ncbi:hypothetical protein ACWEH1_20105 [Micromonospora chersina]